jgi:hypothetical protein
VGGGGGGDLRLRGIGKGTVDDGLGVWTGVRGISKLEEESLVGVGT